jgi:lipopolysaccharide/colanic/teichoic acid biosynthesis glycosyltransferase
MAAEKVVAAASPNILTVVEGNEPINFSLEKARVPHALIKRLMDIVGSLLLIIAFSPILLAAAIAVRFSSPGPILYASRRVGLGGVTFPFLKFRSMYIDAEARKAELQALNEKSGPIFKMKRDPRITPIGRFLRKYSIDELPQLFSILVGDMSLVGPRPPIVGEVRSYGKDEMVRLTVKPGLTCFWQVMGRSDLSFEKWMELDRKYVEEMSFLTDLRILAMTPSAVLRGRGAY